MYLIAVLAFVLIVIYLMMVSRLQSPSNQRSRKSQMRSGPNTDSDPFFMSTDLAQHSSSTPVDSVHEVAYQNDSIGDSTGGELGSALANAIDDNGSGFSAFDSGTDVGGGTSSDWSSS